MKKLFAFMLALTLALMAALFGCIPKPENAGEEGAGPIPTEEEGPDAQASFHRATLYFLSDEGYVVPVTKLIPKETGIAKACLGYMQATPVNREAAARLGIKPVIPEGTRISIKVENGNAVVDLAGMPALGSEAEERAMLAAIVNAMTEFNTVDTVTVLRDGRGGTLENGAALPVEEERVPLNPEEEEVPAMAGAVPVTLYFPNSSGALTVPVTRYLGEGPSAYTVVSALIDGAKGGGLMNCFPEGTLLLGAAAENGRAVVDLSEDFRETAQTEGLYSLAYNTILLTLAERFGVKELELRVNGEPFAPETAAPPAAFDPAG